MLTTAITTLLMHSCKSKFTILIFRVQFLRSPTLSIWSLRKFQIFINDCTRSLCGRAGVQEQVQREESTIGSNNPPPEIVSGQDERDYGPYLASLEKPTINSDGGDVQYDSDGFPLSDTIKKDGEKCRIEPLPTLDHSQISYPPFRKNFYKESNELYLLPEREVLILREELEVSVQGSDVPKPLRSFSMSSLPALLQKEISKVGFEKPTSIQAQALPIALSGRDLIGLAKTGSGVDCYVLPYEKFLCTSGYFDMKII